LLLATRKRGDSRARGEEKEPGLEKKKEGGDSGQGKKKRERILIGKKKKSTFSTVKGEEDYWGGRGKEHIVAIMGGGTAEERDYPLTVATEKNLQPSSTRRGRRGVEKAHLKGKKKIKRPWQGRECRPQSDNRVSADLPDKRGKKNQGDLKKKKQKPRDSAPVSHTTKEGKAVRAGTQPRSGLGGRGPENRVRCIVRRGGGKGSEMMILKGKKDRRRGLTLGLRGKRERVVVKEGAELVS